ENLIPLLKMTVKQILLHFQDCYLTIAKKNISNHLFQLDSKKSVPSIENNNNNNNQENLDIYNSNFLINYLSNHFNDEEVSRVIEMGNETNNFELSSPTSNFSFQLNYLIRKQLCEILKRILLDGIKKEINLNIWDVLVITSQNQK